MQHLPPDFPYTWCSDYGEDEYGVFMAFTYKGVRQGFRWIPPGTFMMGSPEDEVGRGAYYASRSKKWKETFHQVNLTQGYWMAESVCSQALWQAVLRTRPSAFKGEVRPVEQVSWREIQTLIEALNTWQPALNLRLPTEAQWEYACRAGSQTNYWFGHQITANHIHYGRDRETGTLPIKALEPNPLGLYQMHGNVWEWCQDWLAAYPTHGLTNPRGPDVGELRVLRGGSWRTDSWGCRSAVRTGVTPGFAGNNIGFRLARDP